MLSSNAMSPQAIKKQERSNHEQAAIKGLENPELDVLRQKFPKKEALSYQEIEKF